MSATGRPKDGKKSSGRPPAGKSARGGTGGGRGGDGVPARRPAARPSGKPASGSGPAMRRPKEDYPTVQAFVAIGANLGDAQAAVRAAMDAIGTIERTVVTARSSLYQSAPVEATGPDYINAVVAVRTGLTAEAFLSELQLLEEQAGRERPFPNAPRTLDLDLLMHGNTVKDTPALTLPHPRMRERAFVIKPLAEIAPDKVPRAALARVSGQVIQRLR
jgi:2-amino-4-hydroxy-6-hydroxymethyldihydropteridine diphosphokinase